MIRLPVLQVRDSSPTDAFLCFYFTCSRLTGKGAERWGARTGSRLGNGFFLNAPKVMSTMAVQEWERQLRGENRPGSIAKIRKDQPFTGLLHSDEFPGSPLQRTEGFGFRQASHDLGWFV